jgi:hypothetical protein
VAARVVDGDAVLQRRPLPRGGARSRTGRRPPGKRCTSTAWRCSRRASRATRSSFGWPDWQFEQQLALHNQPYVDNGNGREGHATQVLWPSEFTEPSSPSGARWPPRARGSTAGPSTRSTPLHRRRAQHADAIHLVAGRHHEHRRRLLRGPHRLPAAVRGLAARQLDHRRQQHLRVDQRHGRGARGHLRVLPVPGRARGRHLLAQEHRLLPGHQRCAQAAPRRGLVPGEPQPPHRLPADPLGPHRHDGRARQHDRPLRGVARLRARSLVRTRRAATPPPPSSARADRINVLLQEWIEFID